MLFREKKEEEKSYAIPFILLTLILIAVSVWAFWEEVISLRPWKAYQRQYFIYKAERVEKELGEARKDLERPKVQEEYQRLKKLWEAESGNFHKPDVQRDYKRLGEMIKEVEREISSLDKDLLIARNKLQEQEYKYMKFKGEKDKKKIKELEEKIQALESRKGELLEKKGDLAGKKAESARLLEESLEKLKSFSQTLRIEELERLLKGLRSQKIAIKQYYLEDLDKADRCTSCHLGIDDPLQAAYPPPYTTHPASYLFLKNHPPERFGCTICHRGQGSATTSAEKAHGRVEFWEEPMFEGEISQANCQHCHQDLQSLKGAETLREGERLLKKSICFGCHRIDGYENIEKISPPLSRIGEKVNYTWLVKWLMNPSQMMEGASMPNFNLTEKDARAIADYLYGLTQKNRGDELAGKDSVNSLYDEGKVIYSQSICSICHSASGRGGAYKEMYAPDLTRAGSKIKKDWFLTWLMNPKDYFKNERMPHYRFSEKNAKSLAEYLNGEYVDSDLEESKMGKPSIIEEASRQRGALLIRKYGCFGCHDIEGMKEIEKIGPYLRLDQLEEKVADELTSFGDKPMEELDFGKEAGLPRMKTSYLRRKLENPRAFRDDAVMPQYRFSEREITALATLILGFTRGEPLAKYRVERKKSDYQPTGEFAEILNDIKCLSCHRILGKGEDYAPDLSLEGSKVKRDWLKKFLESPDIIRPLSEQMPRFNLGKKVPMAGRGFSRNEVDIITDYILTNLVSKEITRDFLEEKDISQDEVEQGKKIYAAKGCQACHQIGEEGGAVGPPLTAVGSRLVSGYIYKHLLNPRIVNPNTVEPDLSLSEKEALSLTKFLMMLKGKSLR